MDFLIGAGLVCGILAAVWIPGSIAVGFVGWGAFLAWATFYSIGTHGWQAFKGTIIVNMVGVFWGFVMATLAGLFGPVFGQLPGLGVAVFIGTVFMLWEAKWVPALKFIPGVFLGAATFFGTNFDLKGAVIALLCGAVIAWASEKGSQLIAKKQPQTDQSAEEAH